MRINAWGDLLDGKARPGVKGFRRRERQEQNRDKRSEKDVHSNAPHRFSTSLGAVAGLRNGHRPPRKFCLQAGRRWK
jgi:hypothetical protein